MASKKSNCHGRKGSDDREDRAIPPSHRNLFLIFGIDNVVRLIRFEDRVMNDGMGFESIIKVPHGSVHDIPMEQPLESGAVGHRHQKSNDAQ